MTHPLLSGVPDILSLEGEENKEERCMWDLVRDSKKVSEKQREEVFDFICEHFFLMKDLFFFS